MIDRRESVVPMVAAVAGMIVVAMVWNGPIALAGQVEGGSSPPPNAPVELRGKVVGPDGKAVAGARMYLIRDAALLRFENGHDGDWPAPRARAVTGADGEFRFTLAKTEAEGRPLAFLYVLAVPPSVGPADESGKKVKAEPGPGLGVVWAYAEVFDASGTLARRLKDADRDAGERTATKTEPVLHLVKDDSPLAGQVKGPNGRPVAGATVSVMNVWKLKNEDLTNWLRAVEKEQADFDRSRNENQESFVGLDGGREDQISRILTAVTDRDGKFQLPGIGRERIVLLQISGPGIQTERVHARTRQGPALKVRHVYHTGSGEEFTFYGANFEHNARASVPIVGTIRDEKSGRPVKGVVVSNQNPFQEVRAVTDAKGRYRLDGLGAGGTENLIAISSNLPYLASAKSVDTSGKGELRVDWNLFRGVLIKGQVTDASTGKGVMSIMQYYVHPNNSVVKAAQGIALRSPWGTYPTDFEGRYTMPGLPGEGIVSALASLESDDYLRGFGADRIGGAVGPAGGPGIAMYFPAQPGGVIAFMFNTLAKIDVPKDATEVKKDLRLDSGETLKGRVLDPEGRPLAGVQCCGAHLLQQQFHPAVAASGEFEIKQYAPDVSRTILFYHPDRKLAGSIILKGPQPKPLDVRLQPGGVVTGRLVDSKGQPQANAVLVNRLPSFEDAPEIKTMLPLPYYHTDKDGRFRIDGLAPGLKYAVLVQQGTNVQERTHVAKDVVLKSGETKDVGDITVDLKTESSNSK